MKHKISKQAPIILSLTALLIGAAVAVGGIRAYFTNIGPTMENNFTIALGVSHVIVEKFPFYSDLGLASSETSFFVNDDGSQTASYDKLVQVANTGFVDEYIRVKLECSDSDVMATTSFSSDGTNYYCGDPKCTNTDHDLYINHLPDGWVYNSDDGFYYYTKIVEAGDWDALEKKLDYDAGQFRYFYKNPNTTEVITGSIITTPLIKHVKNRFEHPQDIKSYGINIVAQSCPFYNGSNYIEAWANYDPNDF